MATTYPPQRPGAATTLRSAAASEPTGDGSPPVRVASVPASHVYVRHLADPEGTDGVVRLADVRPPDGATVPGGWWPPVMLDASWIREHRSSFDVFHVHFGFDAKRPDELREIVEALDDIQVPLVVTVHDLRNPHHHDRRLHDEQLEVLIQAATAILTLTPGAAGEIARRWGRDAIVVPHPHVVGFERMRHRRLCRQGRFVVGMHAKSIRANMDPVGVARALVDAVEDLPSAMLRIDLHDELFEPACHWYSPEVAAELVALGQGRPNVEVRVHPYFGDEALWGYLESLDASVLPYRFGTHSGWLEACHDLGTTVIAPDCGYYAEQSGCLTYHHDDGGLAPETLHAAVMHAQALPRRDEVGVRDRRIQARREQRREIAAAHRSIYRKLSRSSHDG